MAPAAANQGAIFSVNDTKVYVPVSTVLTQDNTKLLKQSNAGFKTVNWNKYQLR